ncbi:MAG: molybdopterin-dependent oxidoreductase [Bryobacteraceae bacterium]|nr:molybdopterin-dependent oxidoreductase [Bryobacteraceae bacterium]
MSITSRRKWLIRGLGAAAGVSGLGITARLAARHGLIPPDAATLYGLGGTLTYASHRLITRHSLAREFPRSLISPSPFANPVEPPKEEFRRLQAGGFAAWRLEVGGMAARPASFSLDDLRRMPSRSQITQLVCEEGWSYIAEWTGVPLAHILDSVRTAPRAKFVVYSSADGIWWDSIDMADALHPQTLVTYAMNGSDLPVGFGGPLRMRVPRQLGYKSVKFINRLTITDNLSSFGKGLGSGGPEFGYAWYAGI